jgi:hypothetical protein
MGSTVTFEKYWFKTTPANISVALTATFSHTRLMQRVQDIFSYLTTLPRDVQFTQGISSKIV